MRPSSSGVNVLDPSKLILPPKIHGSSARVGSAAYDNEGMEATTSGESDQEEKYRNKLPPSPTSPTSSSFGNFLTVPRASTDTYLDGPRVTFIDEVDPNAPPLRETESSPNFRCESGQSSASGRGSMSAMGRNFTKRASQIILEVPAAHLRKINQTEGVNSWKRETKHFSDNTTLHGPKRIFYGKHLGRFFWVLMMLFSAIFLLYQVIILMNIYFSHPTVSQVSFIVDDGGLDFPLVTMCNFNPVKKTFIRELNKTHDFSDSLLDYILQSNEDVNVLFANSDRAELHVGERELDQYQQNHPNFTINGFFMDAGFACNETMMLCSFDGRQFDCCKYMKAVLSNMGKCYTLDLKRSGLDYMQKQTEAGVNAGLQLILDSHLEEQFDGTGDDPDPIFANTFENGFRYYIHADNTIPYLASEGISVSPSTRVYSAITTNKYILLSSDQWGNCSSKWPSGYSTFLPYTSANCQSLCKAKFFNNNCGCSPFTYNIDESFNVCTPYQTYQCIDKIGRIEVNGTDIFKMSSCTECTIECQSVVYHAYNSYGHGFSNGALKWLSKKNPTWSTPHMKGNFLTINVFFRDMGHTEYAQVAATSFTEMLSDVGGNMGMFLGMSLMTLTEVFMYFSKVSWIIISKKRRDYLYNKKQKEKEREKELEETLSGFKLFKTRKPSVQSNTRKMSDFSKTRDMIKQLRRQMSESFNAKKRSDKVAPGRRVTDSVSSLESREAEMNRHREKFMKEGRKTSLYKNDSPGEDSMIQFKLNLEDLRRNLQGERVPVGVTEVGRRRASTLPVGTENKFYLWKPPKERSSIEEEP